MCLETVPPPPVLKCLKIICVVFLYMHHISIIVNLPVLMCFAVVFRGTHERWRYISSSLPLNDPVGSSSFSTVLKKRPGREIVSRGKSRVTQLERSSCGPLQDTEGCSFQNSGSHANSFSLISCSYDGCLASPSTLKRFGSGTSSIFMTGSRQFTTLEKGGRAS